MISDQELPLDIRDCRYLVYKCIMSLRFKMFRTLMVQMTSSKRKIENEKLKDPVTNKRYGVVQEIVEQKLLVTVCKKE